MGNSQNPEKIKIPEVGYRILSIQKISTSQKTDISIMTDYILSPNPKMIDLDQQSIDLEIYSILDRNKRIVNIQIEDRKLGLFVRYENINQCILRITKIFPGSPLQKYHVLPHQFIVGLLEGNQYYCLNTFAILIKRLCSQNRKVLSLGICNQDGLTRLVVIPMKQIQQWKNKKNGILGCQLAEGWINRWKKPLNQTKSQKSLKIIQQIESTQKQQFKQKQIPIQLTKNNSFKNQQDNQSNSSQQIQQKCNKLMDKYNNNISNNNNLIQFKFKGILKNQIIDDASTICKCKPLNRFCQICFIQKNNHYYFFNKKNNSIIGIPINMMLKSQQHTI